MPIKPESRLAEKSACVTAVCLWNYLTLKGLQQWQQIIFFLKTKVIKMPRDLYTEGSRRPNGLYRSLLKEQPLCVKKREVWIL